MAGVELDRKAYERIVEDMREHAGPHAPSGPWLAEALFPDAPEKRERPTFDDLVVPWVGTGADPADADDVARCRAFLEKHLPGARLSAGADEALSPGATPTIGELRTVVDVALVTAHLDAERPGELRILEVGGGYGRVAEAFLAPDEPRVRYVLVDAVPATLYYAHAYLARRFPDKAVGSYYADGPEDPDAYDCYVLPPWHAEERLGGGYDVAMNISSFQEMRDDQVAWYLELFDRAVRPGGLVYLCNSRLRGEEYEHPPHWRLRFKRMAPWFRPGVPVSRLHKPAEVFARDEGDWSEHNAAVDRDHLEAVYLEQQAEGEAQRRELAALQGMERRHAALAAEVRDLRAKARRHDTLAAEAAELRPKARRYDALAGELRELRSKARRYDILAAEAGDLRAKARRYDALGADPGELQRKARRYDGLAAEARELRGKAHRYDGLLAEVRELRGKARRYEALAAEIVPLRTKARRYDALLEQLPELRSKARRYEQLVEERGAAP